MAPFLVLSMISAGRQLGINHEWRVEGAKTSWNLGLSLIAYSFSDVGDLQD